MVGGLGRAPPREMCAERMSPAFIGRDGEEGGVRLGAQAGEAGLGEGGDAKEFQARAASLPSFAWCR